MASVLNSDATVAVSDFQRACRSRSGPTSPVHTSPWAPTVSASPTPARRPGVFNIDAESIVVGALLALSRDGKVDRSVAAQAAQQYRIDDVNAAPEQTSDPGVA